MLARPLGSRVCFSASLQEPHPPKGLGGKSSCALGRSGLAPQPSPRAAPTLSPARPSQGCRPCPGGSQARCGPPTRRGSCHSQSGAACYVSFVCKHPARRARSVSAARPGGGANGAGLTERGGAGRAGWPPGASRGADFRAAFRALWAQSGTASVQGRPGSTLPSFSFLVGVRCQATFLISLSASQSRIFNSTG